MNCFVSFASFSGVILFKIAFGSDKRNRFLFRLLEVFLDTSLVRILRRVELRFLGRDFNDARVLALVVSAAFSVVTLWQVSRLPGASAADGLVLWRLAMSISWSVEDHVQCG